MQYTKVLNLSIYSKAIQFLIKNRLIIILTVFFTVGFSVAVFNCKRYDFITEFTKNYFNSFIALREGTSFLKIAFNSFLNSMLFIAVSLIFGTSMLGIILVPSVLAVKGYILGNITAYLYSEFSFEGVAFHAVIILLPAVISTVTLLFSAIEAINFSLSLAKLTFNQNISYNLNYEFKRFTFKLLIFSVPILISGIADAILSYNFLKNFSGIL